MIQYNDTVLRSKIWEFSNLRHEQEAAQEKLCYDTHEKGPNEQVALLWSAFQQ